MKRWATRATSLVIVSALSLIVWATSIPTMPVDASTPTFIRPGTVLTNTTLGGFSQVDQVDMLSPTLGYAVATHPMGKDRFRYYLVRTTNVANSWTVRGALPSDVERYPIFSDFDTVNGSITTGA